MEVNKISGEGKTASESKGWPVLCSTYLNSRTGNKLKNQVKGLFQTFTIYLVSSFHRESSYQIRLLLVPPYILNRLAVPGLKPRETTNWAPWRNYKLELQVAIFWTWSESLLQLLLRLGILVGYWTLLILSQYSCFNIFLRLILATLGDAYGPSGQMSNSALIICQS